MNVRMLWNFQMYITVLIWKHGTRKALVWVSGHCHHRVGWLVIFVLKMVIITARSLDSGCDTGLVKVRVPLCPPCPHLTTSSLSPAGATIQTWQLCIQAKTLQLESPGIQRQGGTLIALWGLAPGDMIIIICPPDHSPLSSAALCRTQLVLPELAATHWDSSLTRECLPLTIFRTGAGVNQSPVRPIVITLVQSEQRVTNW